MTDPDRDRETVRDTERTTTVVHTDGDRGRGGGLIIAVVLIVALLALLFFLFGGGLNRAGDEVGVNVDVDAPELKVPDEIKLDVPDKVEVELPDVDVQDANSQ